MFDGRADDQGTHVAGTIGGACGSGQDVAGMCWNLKLISGTFLGTGGGNNSSNDDVSPQYPASYCSAAFISVASITSTAAQSSFSSFGATSVDIDAPGSNIRSTLPGRFEFRSTHGSYSGTSMATPHVSGAAALYLSLHPGATAPRVKAAILNAARPTPSLSGRTLTGGRRDVSGF